MGVNEISDRDIEQALESLAKLAQAGAPMMPDDPAVGEIYDLLGLTRPPERMDDMDLSLNPGRGDPGKPDPDDDMEDNPEDEQIGRASGRQRVCQNVKILVVAVTLKTKQNRLEDDR